MVFFRCWLSAQLLHQLDKVADWEIRAGEARPPTGTLRLLGPRLLSRPPSITVTESQAA